MVTDQSSRLTKQETTIANISDRIRDLTAMMTEMQASMGISHNSGVAGQKTSKQIKLDLPKFSGIDPDDWIFQAEEYFTFHEIWDDSRIQIAGFHMTKAALGWMRGLRQNKLLLMWDRFVEDMRERFGGSTYVDKLQELLRLQQTTSVAVYLEQFEELLNGVSGQSEAALISFFIGGLKPELKGELKIREPETLRKAFSLAKVFEEHRGLKIEGVSSKTT